MEFVFEAETGMLSKYDVSEFVYLCVLNVYLLQIQIWVYY
jgi:hypothetical protein